MFRQIIQTDLFVISDIQLYSVFWTSSVDDQRKMQTCDGEWDTHSFGTEDDYQWDCLSPFSIHNIIRMLPVKLRILCANVLPLRKVALFWIGVVFLCPPTFMYLYPFSHSAIPPPIHPSTCEFIHPFVRPSTISLSIHLSIHSSDHPLIHSSTHPSIHQEQF